MTALSVQEALELMKQTRPDLILSDLSMPEIDGLEFCRMLKSDQATRDIPFYLYHGIKYQQGEGGSVSGGSRGFYTEAF